MTDIEPSNAPSPSSAPLSKRECTVMRHIVDGLNGPAIGAHLGISPRTVEIHRANAITKLGATNVAHAAVIFDRLQRQPAEEPVL